MRWRTFLLLLGVPTALLAGLVLAIRDFQSTVREGVGSGSADPPGAVPDASTARMGVRLVRVGTFDNPVYVTAPPNDRRRLFVVEQGLLSMAFAPDYSQSGRFYVYFTDRGGNVRVQQFRRSKASPDRANHDSRRQVLFVRHPYSNHNGGLLLFGPDRHLYVGIGDGGSEGDPRGYGPNVHTLLGKLLRIDPRAGGGYRSPRSNPFAGGRGRPEIYAYGLRNPWRYSFDRKTGDLYIGDVGQNRWEEIDYARRGAARGRDYGWSCWEGRHRYNGARRCPHPAFPVLEYSHAGGACAVTGGVVVRDVRLRALAGRYVYGDFCTGVLRSFKIARGRATGGGRVGLTVRNLSSFGEDASGRVYAISLSGPVYRLQGR